MSKTLVSVVITTKNEEKHIGNCLEGVRLQTYPQDLIEVIVVDNNSTDRTKEIAQKYTDEVFNKGPERSAQRNFGMLQQSQGKYLLYLDADMILSRTVIERAVNKLEGSGLVALYIPEIVLGNSFWSQVRRFERSFYDGTVVDCVRIIRKDEFVQVGGFDPAFTGQEDWDLDKKVRLRGKVAILDHYDFAELNRAMKSVDYFGEGLVGSLKDVSPAALVYHNEVEFNLLRYLSKKGYYLKAFAAYIKKWGKNDPDIRKQTGAAYRLLIVFVENGKWQRLLRYPLLAMGMYFLRFLVGFCFLLSKFR